MTYPPPGYRIHKNMLWPEKDVDCAAVVFSTTADMAQAIGFCKERDLVIQAGGNAGVWPLWLADRFVRVITFEPEAKNYRCLVANTLARDNILTIRAALGAVPGWATIDGEERNAGAYQVSTGTGDIPVMTIDSLNLPHCDLIYLDIEGSEPAAIFGGLDTIAKFHPVVAIEDKGLSERYGHKKGSVVDYLTREMQYKVVARPNRDVILKWAG